MTQQQRSTPSTPPLIVVMGVSGSGKSTVGSALAARHGVPFLDADDLHPAANVTKMHAGVPLTDDDRWPWLDAVGAELARHAGTGLIVACSALRRVYRDRLRASAPTVRFVHLHGGRDVLARRMDDRHGHFMPPALLTSQLATLEPLEDDEPGVTLDLDSDVETLVEGAEARALVGVSV
ncbi:gluconokinase [Pseudonocardia phyllosphaerae]|uniref:gluconokinase n=1 Tax=Pseudonocardia phyllosphaerae TaxID=3390502 RepID=UPI00397DA18D